MTGFEHDDFDLPATEVAWEPITGLRWPTSAAGVPIGFNRNREPVYLGIVSPEPVRITVTGTRQFHVGIVARSGSVRACRWPCTPLTRRQWTALANHGAPQQFSIRPVTPSPGSIVITDGTVEAPSGPITVMLRRPQSAQAPSTTIVITQDGRRANLFHINTAHGHLLLEHQAGRDARTVGARRGLDDRVSWHRVGPQHPPRITAVPA